MLHLIVQSPIERALLARLDGGDDVVLLQSAVWNAIKGHTMQSELERLLSANCRIHVLAADLETNGIAPERLTPGVSAIDYAGLVELSLANKASRTWS